MQFTGGKSGDRFVHIGAAVLTVVTGVNIDGAVGVKGTATLVLKTQVDTEAGPLVDEPPGLHLSL